ncbi:MAG TPA: MoaD/ThiS family protein [Chthonomonadaceae bacterium]|nr:MoaD/ThiS family protein [Chthonomonadaceae bacterium]
MATVYIPAAMRPAAGGATEAVVPGRTLGEVIENLEAAYPGLKSRLAQEDRLRPGLAAFVNGVSVPPGLSTRVPEDAEIYFAPAIAGGRSE